MDIITYSQNASHGCNYTLPPLPEEYLEVNIIENKNVEAVEDLKRFIPLADSELYADTDVLSATKLTHGEDVKEIFIIELPSYNRHFAPGDTIGIIPSNRDEDLEVLFKQLRISHLAERKCQIIQKNANVKLKSKPAFVNQTTTLYQVFKKHVDIQCLPKKTLVRLLSEYTDDENERKTLMELCSREGSVRYEQDVLGCNKTFFNLITSFRTCCPPVARLLENLPSLSPRPYSIASSQLASPGRIKILFSVVKYSSGGQMQEGICTGMLKSIAENKMDQCKIEMFYRKSHGFTLPEDAQQPLILIGPGTGIAPFLGFLEHRKMQKARGTIWLFYGCRFRGKDYLFEKELEQYLESGYLTKLCVSFSRESDGNAKYVQDNIRIHGGEICDMIFEENAIVYVCGDANGMRKDVLNCFVEILQQHKGLSLNEASRYMKNLQKELRYRQDVWL